MQRWESQYFLFEIRVHDNISHSIQLHNPLKEEVWNQPLLASEYCYFKFKVLGKCLPLSSRAFSWKALSWTSGLTCTHVQKNTVEPKCLTSNQPIHGIHGEVQFPSTYRSWSCKSVPYGYLKGWLYQTDSSLHELQTGITKVGSSLFESYQKILATI